MTPPVKGCLEHLITLNLEERRDSMTILKFMFSMVERVSPETNRFEPSFGIRLGN